MRLAKAEQFAAAAELIDAFADDDRQLGDAYVTVLVHGGIAAADVICCARLGRHAAGENHNEAIDLISRVDAALGRALGVLLGLKTKAGYSAIHASAEDRKRASRAFDALLAAARLER